MNTALKNIVRIVTLGLAASSALAARGDRPSAVKNMIESRYSMGNCDAFTAEWCKFDPVQKRCPQLCNNALNPQSTSSMQEETLTTKPIIEASPTTTKALSTSSSISTTPPPPSSSSSTTPPPPSSSISTTPPPPSSSISTTPPPPTQTKEKNSRVGNFISFLSSTTSQLASVLSTKAPTLTPAPDYDLIKTNQIPLEEQTNQGGVTNSNSNADVTSSVNEPSSSPLPASDKLITSPLPLPLPLSFPPPIDTKNQTITVKIQESKESFYTKPPFIIGTTISGALILGGAVGYVLRQINKKKEGAEDGPRILEAQENNSTDQARGGNNTPSRAPSADADTRLMVTIDPNLSEPPPPESSPSPLNSELHQHSIDDSLHTSKQAGVEIGDRIVNSQPSTVSKTPELLNFARKFGNRNDTNTSRHC